MKTDLEIAQSAVKKEISLIAENLGIAPEFVEPYGKDKAKIALEAAQGKELKSKLILVTAINPTKAGEGKTTCSIGLADSLAFIGKKTAIALREPSLGPVFGVKGGATGGGHAQVLPMEDINLHFTGDLHAITAANNLISACIDNHIHFGNALDIQEVLFRRCLDINDRMLRDVTLRFKEEVRQESFNITVASEIMALLCLSSDLEDLRSRIGKIIIGFNSREEAVTVDDLGITGSVTVLLKDAVKPNLVQTLYHTPVFIHGGPFANIAHGCNSVIATKMAMRYADYTITEAGFGADLGAEKFVDIKCRCAGIRPDGIVVVGTLRALKMHGGIAKEDLSKSDPEAVKRGFANMHTHLRHMRDNFSGRVPVFAALNQFPTDTEEEIKVFAELCQEAGFPFDRITSHRDGNQGAVSLAKRVAETLDHTIREEEGEFVSYDLKNGIRENIRTIARKFYEANTVEFSPEAEKQIDRFIRMGCDNLPICIAKTPYALNDGSEDPDLIHIREVLLSAGAGFIVVKTGEIMTMPGLPRNPLAAVIDLKEGKITGMM